MLRSWRKIVLISVAVALVSCDRKLDEKSFKRKAEQAYLETNSGWGVYRRRPDQIVFIRGDQFDTLNLDEMFADYQKSGQPGNAWFDQWKEAKLADVQARRRSLEQASSEVLPIIKSGAWIRVQDLGAIGPKRLQDKIRPWRNEIAADVFVVLGVPEEKLGYRFASMDEVKTSTMGEDGWMKKSVSNLIRMVGTATGAETRNPDGQLLLIDMANDDGISGLILDRNFRARMLKEFGKAELGAAIPIRKVLIIFDLDPMTIKPVRARTHQLYDTQNHFGFRGLLKFDKDNIGIFEPANPKKKREQTE